jgi:osmotically inducible lipoprotein OsmB
MKTFIIAIAATTALVGIAASARAEERTVEGSTVTGAAIGAGTGLVVAGPPGAVVGGVIGAVVGGPKIVYYQGHRSYTDERTHRTYYWDNHNRHYYVVRD